MKPLAPYTERVEKEIAQLRKQLGSLSTRSDIAQASSYLSSCGVTANDYARHESMRLFIQSQPDAEHLWREIEIFRMIDETSKYFLDDANIDLPTLCELQWAIQTWSHLVLAGCLDLIFAQHPHIEMVRRRGGSPAAMFREYLLAYQVEQDFEAWDERLMNAFRLKVFALDQDLRKTKREVLLSNNSPEQASTAVQSMVEATAEAVAAQGNSPSPHLVTSRDLRSAKRRKIDTVDTIDDKVVPKRECLIKTEVNDSMEALYNASPPPSYQRPSAVHPPISTLSVRDTRKTPLLKNEVESLENISGTPPLQLTIAQLEQYLEQSPSTNMRRLRRNLTECTERHGSASEVANIELGKLISALEKHNVLDKDTTTRLEAVVEYFEEEFEEWESSTMRDQASALRGFMDSIHTATLELLGAWNSATESFERYVEVLAEKEKWEREVETAKLLDADFRDI